jgi:hypothetical protein
VLRVRFSDIITLKPMKTFLTSKHWVRFKYWFLKHRKVILISFGVAVLLVGGVITYLVINQKPASRPHVKAPVVTKPAVKYYSPLTGSLVANEAITKYPVTGVMIENSPDARPQSGLKNSGIVFEAIAEGGITRFLVLYQAEKPQVIGPVRSLRLYDVDWLAPFNAGIAHVGGSAAALTEIRNGSYRDLDQFFNSQYYWRATDRYAPHNVYTSFEKLDALNAAKGYNTSTFTGFSRADGKPVKVPDAANVNITISSSLYNSSYVYDPATNTYARSQGGAPHLDRESGQITPSVVIAMRVDEVTVNEDGYRESITTTGSGAAVIFQNGTAINATWSKPTHQDQISFTDSEGNPISLARGQTWISAVPNNGGNVAWN